MAFPPPPNKREEDSKLTDEETMFILEQYLRPSQFSNPQIIKFILHYMQYRSSPDAAEHAGWNRQRGSYYRSRPEIHAAIEALTNKALMKYGYDATEVIERVKEIAVIDPIEFQNPDGSFKTHMSEIRPEARRAIKKFKAKNIYGQDANGMQIVIGQLLEVELWDKLKGLELLGTEKNVLKKTTVVQHDVTTNMQSLLLESGRRADERKALMAREVGGSEAVWDQSTGQSGDARRDGTDVSVAITSGSGVGGESVCDITDVSGQESFD
jgi:hypothetical protein